MTQRTMWTTIQISNVSTKFKKRKIEGPPIWWTMSMEVYRGKRRSHNKLKEERGAVRNTCHCWKLFSSTQQEWRRPYKANEDASHHHRLKLCQWLQFLEEIPGERRGQEVQWSHERIWLRTTHRKLDTAILYSLSDRLCLQSDGASTSCWCGCGFTAKWHIQPSASWNYNEVNGLVVFSNFTNYTTFWILFKVCDSLQEKGERSWL